MDRSYTIPVAWTQNVQTIVDLGAHIGLTTLFFAARYPVARFACVEPSKYNLPLLAQNLRPLGVKVQILDGAAAATSGSRYFEERTWRWGGKLAAPGRGRLVRCYAVPEIMHAARIDSIDILKVDIEGAERELFTKDADWLECVRLVIVEPHEYPRDQVGADLARWGLDLRLPDAEHRMLIAVRRA
jgi:FkbM family methyltransferase